MMNPGPLNAIDLIRMLAGGRCIGGRSLRSRPDEIAKRLSLNTRSNTGASMNQPRRTFLKQSAAFSLLLSHPALAAQAKKQFSRLAHYDALGLAALIKSKQVSPLELVDDVIRRVERVNPKINAVLIKNLDFERVRDRARKVQLEGMFAGVPVMLKN